MKKIKAFTLIELVVVVALIVILTGVAIVSYSNYREKSRDARRKTDLSSLREATELYRTTVGSYPETSDGWISNDVGTSSTIYNALARGGYISSVMCGPQNTDCSSEKAGAGRDFYMYYRDDYLNCEGNSNKFSFYAKLESPTSNDLATMNSDYAKCNVLVGPNTVYGMNYRVGN